VTGNPTRAQIEAIEHTPEAQALARKRLGVPVDRRVLAAAGGSLGARRVNEAILELCARWSARSDLAVHHVVGSRDYASVVARSPQLAGLYYRAVEQEAQMPDLLAAADAYVGRAGGSTVAELALAGLPSVLVPLPIAPDDHQRRNAEVLERVGAAVIVDDPDCTGARLDELLDPLLGDPARLAAMAGAARGVGRPGAAGRVAELVESHARRRR
jgi:UDP-N-acetylglucosamine--N-acetylmuramyl-(pentapeptide) pyrophosphoryl-undecaprenol N-acetylglucosamine transferase